MAWAPDYCTSAELKHYVRIETGDLLDDVEVALAVTAASKAINKACGRQFGVLAAATEWLYTPEYDRHRGRWLVVVDDFATTAGLIVKIAGVAVTDFVKEPVQGVAKGKVWERLAFGTSVSCSGDEYEVGVTALFGWPSVPAAVTQAALLQGSRFLARRDSPYGVAGSPADGSEMRLQATVDPDVRVSLGDYVRAWAVA